MKEGQTLNHIKGTGPLLQSFDLGLIAALLTCGFEWSSDKALLETIAGNVESMKREYVGTFDGSCKARFLTAEGTSEMSFAEFEKRFRDEEWCEANRDHPIAYLRGFWNRIELLRDHLRSTKPHLKLQKVMEEGDTTKTVTALIPQDCDPATKEELLQKFIEAT